MFFSFAMKADPQNSSAEQVVQRDVAGLVSLVRLHVPDAKVEQASNIVEFTLPYHSTAQFGALFRSLEAIDSTFGVNAAERFGASSFAVSMATLEQVFLRLGTEIFNYKYYTKYMSLLSHHSST